MLPYAKHNVCNGNRLYLGPASRYLGLLAGTLARWDDAVRHFEDALEMNARIGGKPWTAHTEHDYAKMLLARDEPGDREKALARLEAAGVTARELGMKALAGGHQQRRLLGYQRYFCAGGILRQTGATRAGPPQHRAGPTGFLRGHHRYREDRCLLRQKLHALDCPVLSMRRPFKAIHQGTVRRE